MAKRTKRKGAGAIVRDKKCRAGLTEKKRIQPYFQQTNHSRSDTLQATKSLKHKDLLQEKIG